MSCSFFFASFHDRRTFSNFTRRSYEQHSFVVYKIFLQRREATQFCGDGGKTFYYNCMQLHSAFIVYTVNFPLVSLSLSCPSYKVRLLCALAGWISSNDKTVELWMGKIYLVKFPVNPQTLSCSGVIQFLEVWACVRDARMWYKPEILLIFYSVGQKRESTFTCDPCSVSSFKAAAAQLHDSGLNSTHEHK